jgi:hypothetical protein
MTSHVGRLYAATTSIVVFFLTWLVVAAQPWAPEPDPQLAALAAREQRLRVQSVVVQTIVRDRWATYRRDLARSRLQAAAPPTAAPPSVRVVTLPPLTTTRTS